jgi:hypothetical protein
MVGRRKGSITKVVGPFVVLEEMKMALITVKTLIDEFSFEKNEMKLVDQLLGDDPTVLDEFVLDQLSVSDKPALVAQCEMGGSDFIMRGQRFGAEYIGVPAIVTTSRSLPSGTLQSVVIFVDEGEGFNPIMFRRVQ